MNIIEQQSDDLCPHCRGPFEIVVVKFGFRSTAMVAACPNCALAAPDIWGTAKTKIPSDQEKSGGIGGGIWQGTVNMLDQLNLRFKYVLAFMIGAGSRQPLCATAFTFTEGSPAKKSAPTRLWLFHLLR
jgi:hypothetical protein